MSKIDLIATATFGLEAVVAREVKLLGYEVDQVADGRVYFTAGPEAICRCNLWLRSADRVLLKIGTFPAFDFGELFDQVNALPWEDWLGPDASFPVGGRSIKSQLSSVPACQRMTKKAIVERLRSAHKVEYLSETGPKYQIEVALLKDQVTLLIDTSGVGLHKRNYRTLAGAAPLKETLAAAMVQLSYWRPERPLIDPFCGTGTIPIEAAMIGLNIAPGLNRSFVSETWPNLPARLWEAAREEAKEKIDTQTELEIIGTDLDGNIIRAARAHARAAGVEEQIHFQQMDFADLASRKSYGCLITNPPYGERVGEFETIRDLYLSMPSVLRRLDTWSHFILTSHQNFERIVGTEANRRRKLYNGRIECTYYQFHGPRPSASVEGESNSESETPPKAPQRVVPVFKSLSPQAHDQATQFKSRLQKRAHHLRRWPSRHDITCYRLYERDIPEVPLVVDLYEDKLHIAEYERPHERNPAEHAEWLQLMAISAGEVLDIPEEKVFLKQRHRQRGSTQHEKQGNDGAIFEVSEGGLVFQVNLSDYIDTGLFLDHRETRSRFRDDAYGKHVLNLFAYTGSFSAYAADGGAASTTTVDMSNTYLEWAATNMRLNGYTGDDHLYFRDDVMNFVTNPPEGAEYDLVVIDPPTFSNSKRMQDIWDIQRDHVELVTRVLKLMPPGGIIYFSTNFRRFKMAAHKIETIKTYEISAKTVPADFRNKRIHRCWRMIKQD
jgi:23S rRNA (guanine2069-N7)-methyltransferase / 23S rRNA (guanine2445-N2)-methyltransferase